MIVGSWSIEPTLLEHVLFCTEEKYGRKNTGDAETYMYFVLAEKYMFIAKSDAIVPINERYKTRFTRHLLFIIT